MSTIRGFNVYKNDKFVEFIPGRSLRNAKSYIRTNLISTHMGEWKRAPGYDPRLRLPYHYTYSTTVGIYYTFRPATMDS